MSEENIPLEVRKLLRTLEESLKNIDNRKKLEKLLNKFADLERVDLLNRISSFVRYIEDICGKNTANALLQSLSLSLPELNSFLSAIQDEEVRTWLHDLNFRFIQSFEGIFPPFPHDWFRVLWNVKISITHGNLPLLELTILKRNGEKAHLEMPFPASIKLVNYILQRISEAKDRTGSELKAVLSENLENTKKIIDSIMKD